MSGASIWTNYGAKNLFAYMEDETRIGERLSVLDLQVKGPNDTRKLNLNEGKIVLD